MREKFTVATCVVCYPGGEIFYFSGFVKCQIKQKNTKHSNTCLLLRILQCLYNIIPFLLLSIPVESKKL